MRTMLTTMLLAATAASVAAAEDDGKATWTKGYPKAGAKGGQIVVQGTAQAQSGFKLVSAVAHVWPESGGEAKVVDVPLAADGGFGPTTISGLVAGGSYNVIVMIKEARDGKQQLRCPPPVVIKAP